MTPIRVRKPLAPTAELCWAQHVPTCPITEADRASGTLWRYCTKLRGHLGPHTWERIPVAREGAS